MSTIFRDFENKDKKAYMQMSRKFYSSDVVDHDVPDAFFEKTLARCVARDPYVRGIIIEYEGTVAGYALVSLTYSNEAGGMVLLIEEAYISPDFRGKKIISRLFDFFESEYCSKVKRYRLEVAKNNAHAIGIYERFGYKPLEYIQMIRDIK